MPNDLVAEVESLPELDSTTESEQMYLITVARAEETGAEGHIAVSHIAQTLGVSVPSANEMVHKLNDRGLLVYERYRGVVLSDIGRQVAEQVLRTRRLWATFLAEHLGFSPTDADAQACHLEHATTAEAANRLAGFLGNPEAGPLGRPIPDGSVPSRRKPTVPLQQVPVGATAEVISVTATGRTLQFLNTEGITGGAHLTVAAAGGSGVLVVADGSDIHLHSDIAANVEVRLVGGDDASP